MSDTIKTIKKLTQKQQDALSLIAVDLPPVYSMQSTLNSLIKKGLIEKYETHDGAYTFYHYRMPLSVHIAWCEWCLMVVKDAP
jgi:Fe2+ or Zn2+ uptake regulation protein